MGVSRIAIVAFAIAVAAGFGPVACSGGGSGGGNGGGAKDAGTDAADAGPDGDAVVGDATDGGEKDMTLQRDVTIRDSGAQGEKCANLSDDEPPQPVDDDGDGAANCADSECLNRDRAVEACYDRTALPTLKPGESVMGVIGPSNEVDQNLDDKPGNDVEYDPINLDPGETGKFELTLEVHKPGTLEPKMWLKVEGGGGGDSVVESAEGDGTSTISFTHEFGDPLPSIINLLVMDRRNPEPQRPKEGLAKQAPHGGADFTYTVTMTKVE